MSNDDRNDCWALMRYVNGALITCGWYSSPRDAMSRCTHVGQWVEVSAKFWHSDDGRTLIDCRNNIERDRDAECKRQAVAA